MLGGGADGETAARFFLSLSCSHFCVLLRENCVTCFKKMSKCISSEREITRHVTRRPWCGPPVAARDWRGGTQELRLAWPLGSWPKALVLMDSQTSQRSWRTRCLHSSWGQGHPKAASGRGGSQANVGLPPTGPAWPRHRGRWARPTKAPFKAPYMGLVGGSSTRPLISLLDCEFLQRRPGVKFTCFTCAWHTRERQGIPDD